MKKTTKQTAVPTSKAKTAYDLLSEIAALIVAEPKRYNQERFMAEGPNDKDTAPLGFPSCGTVGCVAGWAVTLKGVRCAYSDIQMHASSILGLDRYQESTLFSGSALIDEDGHGPAEQTAAHARAGAKHIRKFQRAHKAQLLAKVVSR